jgi:pimeloyl-ACP methyl ester carboxylesterase
MSLSLHTGRVTAPGAAPSRWLWLLHGIYGAGRNWNAVARRFVAATPDWGVLAVDLRGHGSSDRGRPPHTVVSCAEDLAALADLGSVPAPTGVLGHSFGGKVAILFAEMAELSHLYVIDSTPSRRDIGGSAWRMLEVLSRHPGPFASRAEGIAAVESEG